MSKNVLITGASSGFGFITTKTLLQKGYTVIATMRNVLSKNKGRSQELRSIADNSEGTLHIVELDVTVDSSVEKAFKEAYAKTGHIDVVINNAGIGSAGLAEGFTTKQLQHIFNINVFGVSRVMQAALPDMRKREDGLIINISSIMGRMTIPFAAPYTATKFALEGLTESYKYEVAHTGVDIVLIEPGGFGTGFADRMLYPENKDKLKAYGNFPSVQEKMWNGFFEAMKSNTNINPQQVADAIFELIETPKGERPFRNVVDPMMGGEAPTIINRTTQQIQDEFISNLNMGDNFELKRKAKKTL